MTARKEKEQFDLHISKSISPSFQMGNSPRGKKIKTCSSDSQYPQDYNSFGEMQGLVTKQAGVYLTVIFMTSRSRSPSYI
jgi:hypothetical protein